MKESGRRLIRITRRCFLKAAPAVLFAPRILAQQSVPSIQVAKLHNFGLRVSDIERSLAFYQGLFGSEIRARQGSTIVLRMGDGPNYYALRPVVNGEVPGITHIGLSVPGFDLGREQSLLEGHGVSRGSAPATGESGFARALQSWIVSRGPEAGGSPEGTQDLYFADRDGIVYQLSDPENCGGSGLLGNDCDSVEAAPTRGLIRLRELSHFTNFVHNFSLSNEFHRRLFGLEFQAYQGPNSPVIGVGDGIQFLMYVGAPGEGQPTQAGRLDHVCMGMDDFDVEKVRGLLDGYGLSPRENDAVTPPLVHYVSMRMPNRGGAEGGSPELYFSDPDGIRIQLQDPSYCGGGGYLGDDCPA